MVYLCLSLFSATSFSTTLNWREVWTVTMNWLMEHTAKGRCLKTLVFEVGIRVQAIRKCGIRVQAIIKSGIRVQAIRKSGIRFVVKNQRPLPLIHSNPSQTAKFINFTQKTWLMFRCQKFQPYNMIETY